jgi:hypothetical protein
MKIQITRKKESKMLSSKDTNILQIFLFYLRKYKIFILKVSLFLILFLHQYDPFK